MFELPRPEMIVFAFVIVIYLIAAIVGILQLLAGGDTGIKPSSFA